MPYKLYNRIGSGGFVVEAALALGGVEFERIEIASKPATALPETFRDVNPWRQVPVLILPDGTMMTETAAILIYLATLKSDGELGPRTATPEYAALLRWLVFLSVNVYEATLRRIYPQRYTSDAEGADGVSLAARQRGNEAFALLDAELQSREFLVGEQMSVGDVYLAMLFAWHPERDGRARCQALTHRVAAHPIVAPIWQRHFDHRLAVKWGRETPEL